jgi:hypothetical protein
VTGLKTGTARLLFLFLFCPVAGETASMIHDRRVAAELTLLPPAKPITAKLPGIIGLTAFPVLIRMAINSNSALARGKIYNPDEDSPLLIFGASPGTAW